METALGVAEQASITRAPPDLGHLLVPAVINTELPVKLGIPIKDAKVKARIDIKQEWEIQGVSKGVYLRSLNLAEMLVGKLLVGQDLPDNLNLGTQFNLKAMAASLTASGQDYNSRMYQTRHCRELWVTQSSCSGRNRNHYIKTWIGLGTTPHMGIPHT